MQLFGGERPQTWKYALICKGKEERIVEVGVTWNMVGVGLLVHHWWSLRN